MAICKCLPPPHPLPPKLILQFSPHKNPKRKFFISFFTHRNLSGSHCLAQIGSAKTSPPRAPLLCSEVASSKLTPCAK